VKQPPKVQPVPEPPKPVVPKVDPAVVRAQNQAKQLQSSLASLLKMSPKANALAQVDKASAPNVLDKKSHAMEAAQSEVAPQVTQQNVAVAASQGDAYAQGSSGADVRALGTRGGGMVDIAGAGEQGTQMSEEGLSKREVFEVIQKHMSEIRNCYEKAILRKDGIEGKVLVGFSISSSGNVSSAAVKSSTVNDRFLDQCIVERLKHWAFPRPKGGSRVDVMYPCVFKRL
jgi:TonB family protein